MLIETVAAISIFCSAAEISTANVTHCIREITPIVEQCIDQRTSPTVQGDCLNKTIQEYIKVPRHEKTTS